MKDIIDELNNRKEGYAMMVGELKALSTQKAELEKELESKKQLLSDLELIRILLQRTADSAREKAKNLLENTTTIALQYVFGLNFSAKIDIRTLNGKSSADIFVVTDMGNGEVVTVKPEESCGGGVVDIVSIALRISIAKLKNVKGPIILDEPGKHVSAEYSVKLAEFLKYISTTLGKQIIMVTHNEDLKSTADVSYSASVQNGATVMTRSTKNTVDVEEQVFAF